MNEKIKQYYAKLQGFTMVGLVEDGSPETWAVYGKPMIGLRFRNLDTGKVLIAFPMSDAEGNDEGFLEIVDVEG